MLDKTRTMLFYPSYSSVHKLNPVVKILMFICFIILICITNNLNIHILLIFYLVFLICISKVPIKYYINMIFSLRYILILLLLIFYMYSFTLNTVIVYLIKVLGSVLLVSLITYTTSSSEICYGVEKVFNIINIFRLRISGIVSSFVNLIKFYPALVYNQNKVLNSSYARGIDYKHNMIYGRMKALVFSFFKAFGLTKRDFKNNKIYKKQRGYSFKKYRTNIRVHGFSFLSFLTIIYFLGVILYYLYERGLYEIFM